MGNVDKILSPAELNVYYASISGDFNIEIADKLFISDKTVKFHLTSIYRKLGCENRPGLIMYAIKDSGLRFNKEEKRFTTGRLCACYE